MDRLQQLLEDGVIDEVYQQLKTGKEAEVWLVSHRGEAVAAKLYKDRDTRSFKNDAGYKEGRVVRNTRTQRAMDKGSRFGRTAAEDAWKSAEADAMFALHAAGVHVPKPVLFYDGVLLMEVIGDAEGRVAPRLVDAGLTREQAGPLYRQLRADVIRMLAGDWIHGDLSEFNVLLGVNGPVIIDFPQVVTAAKNSQSERYFRRDLGNLVRFFASIDPALARHERDADDIWRAYVRRHLTPDYEPSDRPHAPQHPGAKGAHPKHGGRPERGPNAPRTQQGNRQGPTPQRDARGPQHDARAPQNTQHGQPGHPRGPQHDARTPQNAQQGQPGHPRGPQHDARTPQNAPRGQQGHPRGPQRDSRAPQNAPRGQQGHPRGPQHDSRAPQNTQGGHPRGPQHDSRAPQHEPRSPQNHPQGRSDSRSPQHEPRSPQNHPQGRSDSRSPQHEPHSPQAHPQGRNDARTPQDPGSAQNPPRGQRNDPRNARGTKRGPEVLIKGVPPATSPSTPPPRHEPSRDHGGRADTAHGSGGRGGHPGGGHRRRPPRRF
jgi:RIO kinase 1